MDEIYIYLIIIMELDEWLETSTTSGAGPSFIEKKTKKEVRAPKFWWLGTRTLVPQMFLTDQWSSFRLWWRSLLLDLVWKDHCWGSSLGAGGLTAGEESDLTKCQSRGKELSSWWVMRGSKMDMKKREEIPGPLFPLYFYLLYQNQFSFSWSKWSINPSSFEKNVLTLHIFYVIITWLWGQPPTALPPSLQKIWKCWNCVLLCSSRGNNCGDNLYYIYMQLRKIK